MRSVSSSAPLVIPHTRSSGDAGQASTSRRSSPLDAVSDFEIVDQAPRATPNGVLRRLPTSAFEGHTRAGAPDLSAGSQPTELLKLIQQVFMPVGRTADPCRSVLFVSPTGADGEATSVATAEALSAHTGRSVCLVDANVRTPSLHRRFDLDNEAGFTDALTGERLASTLAVRVDSRLWLLPAGPRQATHGLAQADVQRAMADLLANFDFVLVAGCSLGIDVDAVELSGGVDGVLVVIDRDSTRRDAARRGVDRLRSAHARVLGAVLEDAAIRSTSGAVR